MSVVPAVPPRATPAPARGPAPAPEADAASDPVSRRLAEAARIAAGPVFFIVGCQKSGTTWVQRLLDGHPEIACRGEARVADLLVPLLDQVRGAYAANHRLDEADDFDDDRFETAAGLFASALFAGWAEAGGARIVGEKTPQHALFMPRLARWFPGSRFVHVIRDGRDGAVSGWFHNLRRGRPDFRRRFPDFAEYVRYYVAAHWIRYIDAARGFAATAPDRCHELRYEDLHADGARVVTDLLRFLGVDAGDEAVTACLDAGSFERLSGGRPRGEADPASHFRKGVVGDWAEHFDRPARAAFEDAGGRAMLERLGYDPAWEPDAGA